jgi:hypothetical protein
VSIPSEIAASLDSALKIDRVAEDPRTQYAFLVGSEESEREWMWHALAFSADAGPTGGFVPVS